jgi:hypothetical protein
MSSIALSGNASGAGVFTIASPNSASSYTITLPTVTGGSFIASDASGNVGIGTSSPTRLVTLSGSGVNTRVQVNNTVSGKNFGLYAADDGNSTINYGSSADLLFTESGTERMRIDSSGNVLVGKTTTGTGTAGWALSSLGGGCTVTISTGTNEAFIYNNTSTGGAAQIDFRTANVEKGYIQWNNTNTTYSTTSDYRLKENVVPMTGALAKVAALKPCTYSWKIDGSAGQGFIAHELAEVVPQAVIGEKDAVREDGVTPRYQGIDTSFLVATLTAAIQEQQAIITSLTARIAALEGASA